MKTSYSAKSLFGVLAVMLLCAGMPHLFAAAGAQGAQIVQKAPADSFFIVSSVNAQKQQMVLKLPTEVTKLVQVTPSTAYRDEQGRPLKFDDLRAGDTIYAVLKQDGKGNPIVVSVRRGPMTLEELHRRYLPDEQAQTSRVSPAER